MPGILSWIDCRMSCIGHVLKPVAIQLGLPLQLLDPLDHLQQTPDISSKKQDTCGDGAERAPEGVREFR